MSIFGPANPSNCFPRGNPRLEQVNPEDTNTLPSVYKQLLLREKPVTGLEKRPCTSHKVFVICYLTVLALASPATCPPRAHPRPEQATNTPMSLQQQVFLVVSATVLNNMLDAVYEV